MRSRWLVVVPILLALAIGVPACKKSEEAPKPAKEPKEKKPRKRLIEFIESDDDDEEEEDY